MPRTLGDFPWCRPTGAVQSPSMDQRARRPERVDGVVLHGASARGRLRRSDQPKEVEKARVLLDLTRLGWGQENHAFLQVWANPLPARRQLEHVRSWCDQQRAATSAEMAVQLLGIGWSVDVSEAARNIKCPVLVMRPDATRWCRSTKAACWRASSRMPASSRSTAEPICRWPKSRLGRSWSPRSGPF